MPLIRKRRIWWEPVPEAASYVIYLCKEGRIGDPAKFLWGNTPGIISKPVAGKTEVIIPDEWPEFPTKTGIYDIAITSRDDTGNQSDPFLLSALIKFLAPPSPSKVGIESLPLDSPPAHSRMRQGRTIIQGGLEEVRDNKELGDAYLRGK